jgi:DNA-directed RNA polymerase specialized sigma24 family protein
MTPAAAEFTAIYAAHATRVHRLVLAELRPADRHQADDLTQDVFLALWRYLQRGEQVTRPTGLLTVMARHRVIDYYRLARVRREVATDPTTHGVFDRAATRELVSA